MTRQWIIDKDGDLITNLAYPNASYYWIESKRFLQKRGDYYDWPLHMAEKNWVDISQFVDALKEALALNGIEYDADLMEKTVAKARKEKGL